MSRRLAGIIYLKVDGVQYPAKGAFTYNLGRPKRDGIVGAESVHGYGEVPQIPFIEGEVTDMPDAKLTDLLDKVDGTVTLELANGKTIVLHEAWFAGEGTVSTEAANVAVRFEGVSATEVAGS